MQAVHKPSHECIGLGRQGICMYVLALGQTCGGIDQSRMTYPCIVGFFALLVSCVVGRDVDGQCSCAASTRDGDDVEASLTARPHACSVECGRVGGEVKRLCMSWKEV